MSLVAWEEALNALEYDLDRVEAALAAGTLVDVGAVPGAGLGQLPKELRFRAAALHDRMGRVEDALASTLARTRQAMVLADRRDPMREVPRFLDTRG